jgi:HSP20 family molecular chaperone IbpA
MNREMTGTQAERNARLEKMQDRPAVAPAVDIYENSEEILIVADMPGVGTDQVTVNLEKGQLTIEGRRTPSNGGTKLSTEFKIADYRRLFAVPQGINAEKIEAELRQGVLCVHLPKSGAMKPRQIQVKAG